MLKFYFWFLITGNSFGFGVSKRNVYHFRFHIYFVNCKNVKHIFRKMVKLLLRPGTIRGLLTVPLQIPGTSKEQVLIGYDFALNEIGGECVSFLDFTLKF